jgi:peptidase E
MIKRQIIAGSGGLHFTDRTDEPSLTIDYILSQTNKKRPRLCYIGTADGDAKAKIVNFYNSCKSKNVEADHLQLFPMPNHKDVKKFLLSQDVIWVGWGSTVNLMAVWQAHGLFEILEQAWNKGVILSGLSAGALCWSSGGTTDSFGLELQPLINKFGLLPYSLCVHYDDEKQRRPLFHRLISEGVLPAGYATENGVSLHFIDTKLQRVISDTKNKAAYHVYRARNGNIVEERLEPNFLPLNRPQ